MLLDVTQPFYLPHSCWVWKMAGMFGSRRESTHWRFTRCSGVPFTINSDDLQTYTIHSPLFKENMPSNFLPLFVIWYYWAYCWWDKDGITVATWSKTNPAMIGTVFSTRYFTPEFFKNGNLSSSDANVYALLLNVCTASCRHSPHIDKCMHVLVWHPRAFGALQLSQPVFI
jgi:hypothetical protein